MVLSRRQVLKATLGAAVLPGLLSEVEAAPAPAVAGGRAALPRIFYNDDVTHLEYVISPYRRRGQPFSEDLLRASIDEAVDAGVDAYVLQPGTGWVPWWKSAVYSAADHYRWYRKTYGLPLTGFAEYMLSGGDMIRAAVEHCRKRKVAVFVSIRLNDVHGLEFSGATADELRKFYEQQPEYLFMTQLFSRVHVEHPEWRVRPGSPKRTDRVWDWAIPEAREHRLRMLEEICRNYDIDGLELDFMRHPQFFRRKMPVPDRLRIVGEVVRRVRKALDRGARGGRRRWLRLRIPAQVGGHARLGLKLESLRNAGADMLNVSSFYFTNQEVDFGEIRRRAPHLALQLEMTHAKSAGVRVGNASYDGVTLIRTIPPDFYTTAHMAYQAGFDGVSLFNFVYYREHEGKHAKFRGPFTEPPFDLVSHLGRPADVARQPQDYFLGTLFGPALRGWQLRRPLRAGRVNELTMQMAPPRGGWQGSGLLRILLRKTRATAGARPRLRVRVNGVAVEDAKDLSDPYPHPFNSIVEHREQLYGWRVPASILREGVNRISLFLYAAETARMQYLELALPELGGAKADRGGLRRQRWDGRLPIDPLRPAGAPSEGALAGAS